MTNDSEASRQTLDELREAVAALLQVEPSSVSDDADLLLLGLDSLGIMRLVNSWRRKGIRVSSRVLITEPTLAAWQRHLESSRRAAASEERVSALRPAVSTLRVEETPPTRPA
ncbi:phosphopantetheine-binding protein [Streptomyces sp. NPDC005374]|uniref:phosphopantetheine-binding protein n=1 Tax=Streptomyces sp. NPDC005374 TaxID=3364713 RepID=UPI0036C192FA